jgi:hypothetical protein
MTGSVSAERQHRDRIRSQRLEITQAERFAAVRIAFSVLQSRQKTICRASWRAMQRRMASYFLNRSSNALRASLGRTEVKPPDAGAGETLTAVGAVSFSMVVRKE